MKLKTYIKKLQEIASLNEILNDKNVSWARAFGYLTGIVQDNKELCAAMDKLFDKIQEQTVTNPGKF